MSFSVDDSPDRDSIINPWLWPVRCDHRPGIGFVVRCRTYYCILVHLVFRARTVLRTVCLSVEIPESLVYCLLPATRALAAQNPSTYMDYKVPPYSSPANSGIGLLVTVVIFNNLNNSR